MLHHYCLAGASCPSGYGWIDEYGQLYQRHYETDWRTVTCTHYSTSNAICEKPGAPYGGLPEIRGDAIDSQKIIDGYCSGCTAAGAST